MDERIAAIDCGTNSIKILIGAPPQVLVRESRMVRLGQGVDTSGVLAEEALARTFAAIDEYAALIRRHDVARVRFCATSATRDARNAQVFTDGVRQRLGVTPEVLTGPEEAALVFEGAVGHLRTPVDGPVLVVDIGGGSTELVLIEPGGPVPRIVDWQSVPWGVVSLTETVGHEHDEDDEAARAARYAEMRRIVADSFAEFAGRVAEHHGPDIRLLGTSGTVTTLASVHLELPAYDRKAVDGLIVPAESMRDISSRLAGMSPAERRTLPCIGQERADLVVAGCAILESILDIWPASRLGVADRGIREGILRSLMAAEAEGLQARASLKRARADG